MLCWWLGIFISNGGSPKSSKFLIVGQMVEWFKTLHSRLPLGANLRLIVIAQAILGSNPSLLNIFACFCILRCLYPGCGFVLPPKSSKSPSCCYISSCQTSIIHLSLSACDMPPKHPLPSRPAGSTNSNSAGSSSQQQWGYTPNASGGYAGYNTTQYNPNFNASGGYAGYNAAGGYPGYGNGYGYAYNASGGYPGYAAAPVYQTSYGSGYGTQPQAQSQPPAAKRFRPNPSSANLTTTASTGTQRSEEEERYLKAKGGAIAIEGTGIKLETEEDIAAWIAERKKKWPTRQRVAEKVSCFSGYAADRRSRRMRPRVLGARIRRGRSMLLLLLRSGGGRRDLLQ